MNCAPRLVVIAAGALFAFAACSESTTTNPADAGKKDLAAHDRGAVDQRPGGDGPRADAPFRDAAHDDVAHLDGPRVDRPKHRELGPKPDLLPLDQLVAKPDQVVAKICTTDKDCKVFEDCCDCKGVYAWETPGICKKLCLVPTCTSLGFQKPVAYCAAGRCLVTEGGGSCTLASDCKKIDNCCDCLALPNKVTAPPCGITTCFVSGCVSQGLSKAVVSCDNTGTCKLVP